MRLAGTRLAAVAFLLLAAPLAGEAQQGMRRVAVVLGFAQDDHEGQIRLAAFVETLGRLGWSDGRNVRLDIRWAGGSVARYKAVAIEVTAASPDVIVAMTNPFVAQLQSLTKTTPIVFTQVSGPVGAGFVSNIARPGGNITGFENFQPETGGKWLELLKEAFPKITRVAFIWSTMNPGFSFAEAETAGKPLGVKVQSVQIRDVDNIE